MTEQAFAGWPHARHAPQGTIIAIGPDSADVQTGAGILRNVSVAKPLEAKDMRLGHVVALLWVQDTPYIQSILGHETGLRDDPYEDTEPPPAPTDLRVVEGSGYAYLIWETPNIRTIRDLAYYEVDARLLGGDWGFDVYPVSEGTNRRHYPRSHIPLQCRVRAVDLRGNTSAWVICEKCVWDWQPPPKPSTFVVTNTGGGIDCRWIGPTVQDAADLAGFHLYITDNSDSTGAGWTGQGSIAQSMGVCYGAFYPMELQVTRYFNLKAFDVSGNESPFALSAWLPGRALLPPGAQLLNNADWERAEPGVSNIPLNWFIFENIGPVVYTLGAYGIGGTKGMRFVVEDGEDIILCWPRSFTEKVSAEPGQPFTWSIHFKTDLPDEEINYDWTGGDGKLTILLRGATHDGIAPYGPSDYKIPRRYQTLSNNWRRVIHTHVIGSSPSDLPYIMHWFEVHNDTGSTVTIDFDRPQIVLGDQPGEWGAGVQPTASSGGSIGLCIDTSGIKTNDGVFHLNEGGGLECNPVPDSNAGRNLGTTTTAWDDVVHYKSKLRDGITAPTAESNWAFLYVDSADSHLKVRHGGGTTTDLEATGSEHDPVTLGSDAEVLMSLNNQQILFDSQPANTVFAAPDGASGDPTFRSLVAGDLVNHTHSHDTDITDISADDHHNQAHVLSGADHTASGLTIGHVIRASGSTTFAWAELQHTDLGGVSSDQHHAQAHALNGGDHTGDLAFSQLDSLIASPAFTFSTSAGTGSASTLVRSDAQIALFDATVPTTIVPDTSASAGSAGKAARRDHAHGITCAAPPSPSVNLNDSTEGSGNDFARAGHTHQLSVAIVPTWTNDHTWGTNKGLRLRDTNQHIYSSVSGQLDIDATTEIELTAPTVQLVTSTKVQVDGALQVDGDLTFVGAQQIVTTADNLTIAPAGDVVFDPAGNDILPATNYDLNLGTISKKYLTLHAAELQVETLVAEDTRATIGGRVIIGATTVLAEDLLSSVVNGTNQITNPGFETAGSGGVDVFFFWTEYWSDGDIVRDDTLFHSGSYSCKLTTGTSADTYIYQTIADTAEDDVEFIFWTRGDGTHAGRYRIYDVTHSTDIVALTSTGVTAAEWQRVIVRYEVPVGCSNIRYYFYCAERNTNELLNPGFETAGSGGADVFANWTESAGDGTIVRDSSVKYQGTYSCKLTAGPSYNTYVYQDISVTAGEDKELVFWTRGDGSEDGRYRVYDISNGANIIGWTFTGVPGTTFTKKTIQYTVPANCTTVRIYFGCGYDEASSAWFDATDSYDAPSIHFDDVCHHDQVTISVEHNEMNLNDMAYLEADGNVEYIEIMSDYSGTGPYTYYAWRDKDGTGANTWYAGSALTNTGEEGDGFIDLYSVHGVKGPTQYGPTIVGNVRNSSVYNDWTEHWAIGNLNGLYGYGTDTFGVGLGKYGGEYVTIDSAAGIRMYSNAIKVVDIGTTGDFTFGEVASNKSNLFWDQSEGRLNFRGSTGGTVVQAYVDTDGSIVAGGDPGVVKLNDAGITLFASGTYQGASSIKFEDGSSNIFGDLYGSWGAGSSSIWLGCNEVSGKDSTVWIEAACGAGYGADTVLAASDQTTTATMLLRAGDTDNCIGLAGVGVIIGAISGNISSGWMRVDKGLYVGSSTSDSPEDTITVDDYAIIKGGIYAGGGTSDPGLDILGEYDIKAGYNLVAGSTTYNPSGQGQIYCTGYIMALGGVHVGGTTDPGTDDLIVDGGIWCGRTADAVTGSIGYTGNLISYKGGAEHAGYARVPITPVTGWNPGTNKASQTLDLQSSPWNLPADIKSVDVYIVYTAANKGDYGRLMESSSGTTHVLARCPDANTPGNSSGTVNCNNGDIYFETNNATNTVYLYITGYSI